MPLPRTVTIYTVGYRFISRDPHDEYMIMAHEHCTPALPRSVPLRSRNSIGYYVPTLANYGGVYIEGGAFVPRHSTHRTQYTPIDDVRLVIYTVTRNLLDSDATDFEKCLHCCRPCVRTEEMHVILVKSFYTIERHLGGNHVRRRYRRMLPVETTRPLRNRHTALRRWYCCSRRLPSRSVMTA